MTHRKYKIGVLMNSILLALFFSLRCIVMNLNVLFSLLVLIQGLGLLIGLLGWINKKYRTKERTWLFMSHCVLVLVFFQFLGHLIGVSTLLLANYPAIQIFKAHSASIPLADRVNGDWILEETDFKIEAAERDVLRVNYQKSSPCFFEAGYCYFEFGGFLHNSGGYALKIVDEASDDPGVFGFTRIKGVKRVLGDWYVYE